MTRPSQPQVTQGVLPAATREAPSTFNLQRSPPLRRDTQSHTISIFWRTCVA